MIKRQGFLQALGVSLYCLFIGLVMGNGNSLFGNLGLPFGPVFVLLLFSTSALICGTIVFYTPYKLFTQGKTKEAFNTVVSTALFLFIFLTIFATALIIFK